MQRHNQQRQEAEITASDELSAARYEIELLREQLEFSGEQIESLNSQLSYTQQQIEDVEQELKYTNQELCQAVRLHKLEHGEAMQLAQKIFKSNKSTSQCLAELLTAIYGCATNPEELEQLDSLNIRTIVTAENKQIVTRLKELKAHSKQLHSDYKNLEFQFANIKNTFVNLSENYASLKIVSKESDCIFNNHFERKKFNSFPPPIFSNY